MQLADAIQDFVNHITHERRLARTTVTGYGMYLKHFTGWLEQNGYTDATLEAFNTPTLRRYLYGLSSKGRRPRTIRGAFHPIIGLGAFLVSNGILKENPAKALTMPKKDAAKRLLVTDEEVSALLQACERQKDPRQVALSRAMLSVLVYAGLRREELLTLRVSDVQFDDKSILVRSGKGSKSRTVYPHPDCLTALREWLAIRPKDCTHDFLWARDRSRRIYDEGAMSILETVKAIAGLADHANIKFHGLRHNFASRLLSNGADIRSIQAALGHAQLTTTAIYLHLTEHQARQTAVFAALPETSQKRREVDNVIHLRDRTTDRQSDRQRRRIAR